MNGTDVILWLQSYQSPAADVFFTAVTVLAEGWLILPTAVLLYWCVDAGAGRRVLLILVSGLTVNTTLKNLLRVERPYLADERIRVLRPETATGYSMPSGHTQNAATFWPAAAMQLKWRFFALAVLLAALVGVSRMYLGVHTLADVLLGLGVGLLWVVLGQRLCLFAERRGPAAYLLFLIPMGLSLLMLLPLEQGRPAQLGDAAAAAGVSLGCIGGIILEQRYVRFTARTSLPRQVVKVLIGVAGLALIEFGLKSILPSGQLFRFFRYGLIGLWAALGVPLAAVYMENGWKKPQRRV